MYVSWQQNDPNKQRRVARSRNGCVTCRRRKVRCNEERPRCAHCRRLQLDCTWKTGEEERSSPQRRSGSGQLPTPSSAIVSESDVFTSEDPTSIQSSAPADRDARFEEVFDYASFLWEDPVPTLWPTDQWVGADTFDLASFSNSAPTAVTGIHNGQSMRRHGPVHTEQQLLESFKYADAPPILAAFESQLKWTVMRQLIISMTPMSKMVHFAVLSYSALRFQHEGSEENVAEYYKQSQDEIASSITEEGNTIRVVGALFQHVLAALFLLGYIDLVSNKTSLAHKNLRRAYKIVSTMSPGKLNSTDKRLISWIRSLDAKAVTAGGEGLFLKEDIDNVLSDQGVRSHQSPETESAEDVLSDILSKPLLYFFHGIQSFTGRISSLDLWHRSRGTVEDETEVMAAAAQIKKDNDMLYRKRPQIMDLAVEGKLQPPLLSPSIAESLTRSSRVYLANFHATFIHLHRVAYKHLPRTSDVNNSKNIIQKMTTTMLESTPATDSLPVTMLWPLLMWGSEEDSPEQREFILTTIRQMKGIMTNAKITADVLEEVIRRQDQNGQRADIRQVMHDTFDMCFAIV